MTPTTTVEAERPQGNASVPAASVWSLLGQPQFRAFNLAGALAGLGAEMSRIVFVVHMFQLTQGTAMPALFLALQTVPPLVLAPAMGVLVDRYSQRRVLVGAMLASAVAVLLCMAWFDVVVILAAAALLSVASFIHEPARQAWLVGLVGERERTAANAAERAAGSAVFVIGPLLGVELEALVGRTATLFIAALAFGASALSLLCVAAPKAERAAPSGPRLAARDLAEGGRHVARNPPLLMLFALIFVSIFCAGTWLPLASAFITNHLHAEARVLGWALAAFGLGGIIGGALVPQISAALGRGRLLLLALFAEAVVMSGYALVSDVTGSLALCCLWGVAVSCITVPYLAIVQQLVPRNVLGRVLALAKQTETVALLIALGVAGAFSSWLPVNQLLLVLGVSYLVVVVLAGAGRAGQRLRSID